MTYYLTIEEDLARAKEILAKGRIPNDWVYAETGEPIGGGVIHAGDIYAVYRLLESFVAEIERYQAQNAVAGLER